MHDMFLLGSASAGSKFSLKCFRRGLKVADAVKIKWLESKEGITNQSKQSVQKLLSILVGYTWVRWEENSPYHMNPENAQIICSET